MFRQHGAIQIVGDPAEKGCQPASRSGQRSRHSGGEVGGQIPALDSIEQHPLIRCRRCVGDLHIVEGEPPFEHVAQNEADLRFEADHLHQPHTICILRGQAVGEQSAAGSHLNTFRCPRSRGEGSEQVSRGQPRVGFTQRIEKQVTLDQIDKSSFGRLPPCLRLPRWDGWSQRRARLFLPGVFPGDRRPREPGGGAEGWRPDAVGASAEPPQSACRALADIVGGQGGQIDLVEDHPDDVGGSMLRGSARRSREQGSVITPGPGVQSLHVAVVEIGQIGDLAARGKASFGLRGYVLREHVGESQGIEGVVQ